MYPDFITVDGSEGGSGATFKAMADGMGLPLFAALLILDDMARKFGVRTVSKFSLRVNSITPDKVAIAMALGADCVNSARGFMMANGCIMATAVPYRQMPYRHYDYGFQVSSCAGSGGKAMAGYELHFAIKGRLILVGCSLWFGEPTWIKERACGVYE